MAIDMSQDTALKILSELFGTSLLYKRAVALINSGAKLTFGLFQFKVQTAPDAVFTAQLPIMSTKIVGNAVSDAQKQLASVKVAGVINSAYEAKFGTVDPGEVKVESPAETAKASISDVIANLKKVVDPVSVATGDLANTLLEPSAVLPKKPKMPFMKPDVAKVKAEMYGAGAGTAAKVDEVIALRDAKAVGQKVKGTSASSVYNAVAIGPVNFAVKFTATNCSIRAESANMTVGYKKKLKDAGFTDNGAYLSMHMKLNGVNAMRAIGAVLYSMDMPFEAVGTTSSQVVS